MFASMESHSKVVRIMYRRKAASTTVVRGTTSLHTRCMITIIKGIREHSNTIGSGVTANRVRIVPDRLHMLSRSRAPPFPVRRGSGAGRSVHLGCHCLSLEEPSLREGLHVGDRIVALAHRFFSSRKFLRMRAPVLKGAAPRNTESCLMPDHVRPKSFCKLPRSPRLCGRLLVYSNMSHCVRVTEYFHSRSLHTSERPRFARVSVRLSFISMSSIVRMGRGCLGGLFGRILSMSMRLPVREVA